MGFHLRHLTGSTDRLLTYARGGRLDDAQRAALAAESGAVESHVTARDLLLAWRAGVDAAIAQLAATPEAALTEPRAVGRAQLPSTVLGPAVPRR